MMDLDLEAAQEDSKYMEEYLPGYVDFSHFIASDYSLSIYRKFAVLGTRNLLYLEAELQLLEFQLHALDESDKLITQQHADEVQRTRTDAAIRSWDDLKRQALEGDERQRGKLRMIYKLRRVMKEYEEALIRRNQVLGLEKPAEEPFKAFQGWFRDQVPLRGSGFHLLDRPNIEDMIALGKQAEPDRISALLHHHLGYHFRQERKTPRSWGKMYYYNVDRVSTLVTIFSILVAAALLIGATLALHFIKPMGIRVGFVGAFTVIFAISLVLFTSARKVEIYGATAAYTAVLVVFISVNN